MARISVIVPVYKVEPYLRQCVDSILGQTFTDFELILVDDGSPDKCGEICDEYARKDSRILVVHQENQGLSAARNTGIQLAIDRSDSQYISFVDSDDIVASDYFECLLSGMNDSVDVSCVRPFISADLSDNAFPKGGAEWLYVDVEEYWCDFGRFPMSAWGKLYRKSLFDKHRYPIGKIHEDEFFTYLILFNRPKIAFLNVCKYGYRSRSASIMSEGWKERHLVRIDALKHQIEFFRERGFRRAELKTVERLCSEDFVRAISQLKRIELLSELKDFVRTYGLPIENHLSVYKLLYPLTYKLRWYKVRLVTVLGNEGLRGLAVRGFKKFRVCHV